VTRNPATTIPWSLSRYSCDSVRTSGNVS
jgi:hypothetical protein